MTDAELIIAIRSIRKLIVILDSIGFPIQDLSNDEDISKLLPKNIQNKIIAISSSIHSFIQKVECNKRYKNAAYKLCSTAKKKTFMSDGGN